MEFWGVEVKAGQVLPVKPEDDMYLHLSQATLGEVKKDKGNESVTIYVKIGDQKLVLGNLSSENFPQLSFDLVFEKEFELSHNWKNGSVYFCGYQASGGEQGDEEFSDLNTDSEEEKEDFPLNLNDNGKPGPKVEETKSIKAKGNASKPESTKKVRLIEPNKDDSDEDGDSDSDDESGDESDEELGADSDEDEDESDEESDEETPKKAENGKRKLNESATKTPVSAKKAKTATPQTTDSKKGGHVDTPYPNKKAGKTPANSAQKAETPKSGGQVSCKSCNKSFGSDNALQSHNKAKHSAK